MDRGHSQRGKIRCAGSGIPPIYSTHRHIHCIITGGRTVCRVLLYSRAKNTDSRHIVSDGKPDCVTRSDTSWNMIIKSSQSPQEVK